MKYEEFIEYVRAYLITCFEPDASIIVHRVLKNNNTALDGISVLKKNQTVSPTLYLNDYYEEYLCGTSIEALLEELYHNFLHPYTGFQFSISDFKKFSLMKGKIVYRLINYEANTILLSDVPHKKYLDLAIVYYLLVHSDEQGNACILIRNEHMELWETNLESLHQYASKNTPLLLPASLRPMEEMIHSFLSLHSEQTDKELFGSCEEDSDSLPMYVLTNETHLNGAAVLLYDDILKEFSHSMQENFYILPSSIHEVILIAANGTLSKASLDLMVKDVNQQEVTPMERLSDHVYFYDRLTHTITM